MKLKGNGSLLISISTQCHGREEGKKKYHFFNAAFKIEKQKKFFLQHLIGLPCNLKTDFQKLIYSNLQSLFEGTSEGAPCNLCVANSFESCP